MVNISAISYLNSLNNLSIDLNLSPAKPAKNAIKTAMDTAGTLVYTVVFAANKLSISSTNVFDLFFDSGINRSASAAATMGFFFVDKSGLMSYSSDTVVKVRQAVATLKYDIQDSEIGHIVTDTKIKITNSYISSTVYWGVNSVEDFNYNFVDYPTISSLLNVLSIEQLDYVVTVKSELWSRSPQYYTIYNNETFAMTISTDPTQSATFSFTNGVAYSDNNPANTVLAGDSMMISLNGETAKNVVIPANTISGPNTASIIQTLVKVMIADTATNQPAYTNFLCVYQNGLYYMASGTAGTASSVNVVSGSLKTKLKLNNVTAGTGDVTNNYFVSVPQIISKFSSFANVTVSNDTSFIKFTSSEPIVITSSDLATRLGFYGDNLQIDPAVEYQSTYNSSLVPVAPISIQSTAYSIKRGYEDRGNIIVSFYITDDSVINSRRIQSVLRYNTITARRLQIFQRQSEIQLALSESLYLDRWTEIKNRLNKKTGPYYKVGEKSKGIVRSQQQITDNNTTIGQIQTMLGA